MPIFKHVRLSLMAIFCLPFLFSCALIGGDKVSFQSLSVVSDKAWVRAVPPVSKNSAAYFDALNLGDKPVRLVAAQTSLAEHVEIHEVIARDGGMGMRPVSGVDIPAGGVVTFSPGGFHLMLIGLKRPIAVGRPVEISLIFEDGSSSIVAFDARFMQVDERSGEHDHDRHHHVH